jgi:hypothetical protein
VCFLALADPRGAILEKVHGVDGLKIEHIAAGAEHSAVVTGKVLLISIVSSLFCGQLLIHILYNCCCRKWRNKDMGLG